MSDDEQTTGYSFPRKSQHRLKRLEQAIPIAIQPPTPIAATYPSNSSNVTLVEVAAGKEETVQSDTLNDGTKTTGSSVPAKSTSFWRAENLPSTLQWIPANWTWSKWIPVLRSALAAWISLLLFVAPMPLNVMGRSAFLIIIASFLSPPSEPFIILLQRELGILIFAASAWAWSCLGIKLADFARSNKDLSASSADIIAGHYLEPAPSIILAAFLFVGSFFFLYIKSRLPPGPLTFAYLFSCMTCLDMSLTLAALYPYPYYTFGQNVVVPLMFHSAIALLLSLCFFPTSASTTFSMRLQDVLLSLVSATKAHHQCPHQGVTASNFSLCPISAAVGKAESTLAALSSAAQLQKFDIIYSRFTPSDYTRLHSLARGLVMKASGMSVYYTLIEPTREKSPLSRTTTPAFTPSPSPSPSRPSSPIHDQALANANDYGSADDRSKGYPSHRSHSPPLHARHPHRKRQHLASRQNPSHYSNNSQSSLLSFALTRATRTEAAVGVFESLKYLDLEATHMSHPDSEAHVVKANELLRNSCQDLLKSCEYGLQGTCDWLPSVKAKRFHFWMSWEEKNRIRIDSIKKLEDLRLDLSLNLDEFINKKRFTVLDPYRAIFSCADDTATERETPSHRHLFHCYVYQYHLMRYATSIRDMLNEIIRLEIEREVPRIWFPKIRWTLELSHTAQRDDDEDPDVIPGLDATSPTNLGRAVRRDPDALPPRNALERFGNWLHHAAKGLGGGNALYALKASILTIILSLPSFLRPSTEFAYRNTFVWAVVMSQLTSTRFRGDTIFHLIARIISTLVGGTIGTLVWYISTGSGDGSAFGLAAVCFICFPIFFFFRLYWPVAPMINLIVWVTTALVIGYSWQDTHLPSVFSPGYGINVAWRRFVLVVAGVMAAGILSCFPPATTIRQYQRKTLATVTEEIGTVYCSIMSFAHTKREGETAIIVQHLLAILNKLKRSDMLKKNAAYEISFRGRWPAERYQRILELQIQITDLLSHLVSVLEQMEPTWAQAFLKRTRLSDADFQGDVLAVMSLISFSLRTGKPLPQVTPCPLLNRFMERNHGLNVIYGESEDDFGLPKMSTEGTLENLQYMIFCVGVSTTFDIMTRLDKLMVAVKELVGEQYHIDGVGLPLYATRGRGVEMRSPVQTLT